MGRTEVERSALVQCGSCYHFVPSDADGLPTPNHLCYRADPAMREVRAAEHDAILERDRLRAERDLLAAAVRAQRKYREMFEHRERHWATDVWRAQQDADAALAAVDAAGCLKGEGERDEAV